MVERELTNGEREPKLDKKAAKPANFSMDSGQNETPPGAGLPKDALSSGRLRRQKDVPQQEEASAPPPEEEVPGTGEGEGVPPGDERPTTEDFPEEDDEEPTSPGPRLSPDDAIDFLREIKKDAFSKEHGREPTEQELEAYIDEEEMWRARQGFLPLGHFSMEEFIRSRKPDSGNDTKMDELSKNIDQATTPEHFNMLSTFLLKYLPLLEGQKYPGTDKTYREVFNEMTVLANADLEGAKFLFKNIASELKKFFEDHKDEAEREKAPESLEELVELIMKKESDEYKTGGVKELMSEDGIIRPENLILWVRTWARFWSNFSPDDPNVQLFSSVSIPMLYRTISLSEMVTNPQYFRRRDRKIVIGKDDKPSHKDTNHEDKKYIELRDTIKKQIYFYNMTRNFNTKYALVREQETELPKVYQEIMATNILTKEDGFEVLFSSPGITQENVLQEEGAPENTVVGKMTAVALSAYDSISDFEELQRMLGSESAFFRKEYIDTTKDGTSLKLEVRLKDGKFVIDSPDDKDGKSGKKVGEGKAGVTVYIPENGKTRSFRININWNENWYGQDGKLKTGGPIEKDWVRGQFVDYVNIFNELQKDPRIIKEVRERIRQSLTEKMLPGLLREDNKLYQRIRGIKLKEQQKREQDPNRRKGYTDEQLAEELRLDVEIQMRQLAYQDALHAEEVAFSQVYWSGIGAKNDTTDTGFDAGTKFMETEGYRKGQGNPDRAGEAVGNIKTIGIYKRLVAPFLIGIKTLDNSTPLEIIRKIANGKPEDNKDNDYITKLAKRLVFASNTMRQYGSNHFGRGADVFKSLAGAEELDLEKMIKWDPVQGFSIDRKAFLAEVNAKFIKPERYRASTYSGTMYQKDVRVLERETIGVYLKDENGDYVKDEDRFRIISYEDKKLGSAMFGEQVFDRHFRNKETGEIDFDTMQKERAKIWKEGLMVRIAADVSSHRDVKDPSVRWDNAKINGFWRGLSAIPASIIVDEKDFNKTKATDLVFTKEMIDYMRKLSKTERWRMNMYVMADSVGGGVALGVFDSFKKFFSELFK